MSAARLSNSVFVVRVAGEFDLTNVTEVIAQLDAGIDDAASAILAIDLRGVTFLDSTLLQALLAARDRAQSVRKPVWLIRPGSPVWRVFEVTMTSRLFRDFGSLEELESYAEAAALHPSPG